MPVSTIPGGNLQQTNTTDPSYGALPEYKPQPTFNWNDLTHNPGGAGAAVLANNAAQSAWNAQQQQGIPGVQTPTKNPLASQIYNQQLQAANNYASQIPQMSDSIYNPAAATARQGLASTIRSNRNSYNSRGLLNSGGEQGSEAAATATTNQGLQSTRQSINQGLLSNANTLYGNAFSTATGNAQPGPETASTYLSGVQSAIGQQTGQQQLTNSTIGGLASGVGAIGGLGLASAMYGQQTAGGTPLPSQYNVYNPNNTANTLNSSNPYGSGQQMYS